MEMKPLRFNVNDRSVDHDSMSPVNGSDTMSRTVATNPIVRAISVFETPKVRLCVDDWCAGHLCADEIIENYC